MGVFRNLTMLCFNAKQQKEIIAAVIAGLNPNWTYQREHAFYLAKELDKDISEIACFESPMVDGFVARIWFVSNGSKLEVCNIVPVNAVFLTKFEYNKFLEIFYHECISVVAERHNARVEINMATQEVEKISISRTSNLSYPYLTFTTLN